MPRRQKYSGANLNAEVEVAARRNYGIYNCGIGRIEYVDFPAELVGKYQSFTQADTKKLIRAGYDGGFTPIKKAVKEYCEFLDDGGYFKLN